MAGRRTEVISSFSDAFKWMTYLLAANVCAFLRAKNCNCIGACCRIDKLWDVLWTAGAK